MFGLSVLPFRTQELTAYVIGVSRSSDCSKICAVCSQDVDLLATSDAKYHGSRLTLNTMSFLVSLPGPLPSKDSTPYGKSNPRSLYVHTPFCCGAWP